MLLNVLMILLGLGCLVWGGDRFVTGAAAFARNLGISPMLIGVTIVAIGTSAPELCVSFIASLQQRPGIAVGNVLGSNIANIGLVIGITALIKPINVQSKMVLREFPILFLAMLVAALVFYDGNLNQIDGIVLLAGLISFLVVMTVMALRQRNGDALATEIAAEIPDHMPTWIACAWIVLGIILLPIGSEFLIKGASDIARAFGISELIIGLTVVAVGTSLPELVASLFGILKNEDDIALGNIIGSNIFNLGALAFPGLLAPSDFGRTVILRDFVVMLILTVLFYWMCRPRRKAKPTITRANGVLLMVIYISYLGLLAHQQNI